VITISSLWFWILIEALAATTIIALVLIVLMFVRKNRDRKAAAVIIQKIKEDEARRTAETKKIMLHKFGFEDGDAEKLAVRTDRAERVLYQSIINMYLQRDVNALEGLNISFETAVEPYRTLEPPGGGTSGGSVDESKELKKLREENKRLSEEIGVTMQTMGRMLSEYSTMFAEKAQEQEKELQQEAEAEETQEEQEEPIAEAAEEPGEESGEVEADEAEEDEAAVAEVDAAEHEESEAAEAAAELEEIADDAIDEMVDAAKDVEHVGGSIVEDMDDLSDLDTPENKDLKDVEAPDNPDELIG
jgi:hypothetical protein